MYAYLLLIFLPADVFKINLSFWGREHSYFYRILVCSHISSCFWLSWCSPHIGHWLDKCGTSTILLLKSLMIGSPPRPRISSWYQSKWPIQFLCQRLLTLCHGFLPKFIHTQLLLLCLFFFVPHALNTLLLTAFFSFMGPWILPYHQLKMWFISHV